MADEKAAPQLTEQKMAARIDEALFQAQITHAEFCRRVGVSQKHLSLVLSGKASARPAALDYWAFVLGFTFDVTLVPRDE